MHVQNAGLRTWGLYIFTDAHSKKHKLRTDTQGDRERETEKTSRNENYELQ